ncbi:N-acetylmuramoyl-L-alanine amidase [Roseobacter denitrificans]|uniref:N-acetylmuramoyl-L-alanine amidase n=1 Tax=Roseobacter denitrificans (strain ATCC 33942 / OCh 114) TaxID=375451 RepID=Q165J4_ROSDO|nr:N-acetylmuramoyl-L-alanine amidase [Roseobacter denitrificans]ABG32349.1 N-acetylmuramoyl-L-alanine amidase, putative [Roseobacter denitrificans OCh 114]AVL51827.1 N-acetylmuramoyl-L-alanine amidase [Roseobacter denitrificans]SFF80663.1 N-acetylmuramoyl-L-alanine amidase [Roseobacter denitrificans OCh 114]
MIRYVRLCALVLGVLAAPLTAQDLSGVARVDVANSHIKQNWFGRLEMHLALSQGVPYRVFTLDQPPRLVVDFREVDWSGVSAQALLDTKTSINALRFGVFQPGWSRLVADLAQPMLPEEVAMTVKEGTGAANLTLVMQPADPDTFASTSGVPQNSVWPVEQPNEAQATGSDDRFVVVIDPGHGGIDPGAEREGLSEKTLMLDVAFELRAALMRAGDVDVVLTRDRDVFVSLQNRVAQAHRAGADVFLSLHADALSEGGAQGATVYTLSEEASDTATAHLAVRHNRADIIAGADLTGSDNAVTTVLLDLARVETEPRSKALAHVLVDTMGAAGGPMNTRPLRQAGFSVLKSADIPSVLVEVGFLSSARDLENLRNPEWRSKMVEAMARAILQWRVEDAEMRALIRQ